MVVLLLPDAAAANRRSVDQFLVDRQRGIADDSRTQRLRGQRRRHLHEPRAPLPALWTSAPPGDEAGPASLAEGGVMGSKRQAAHAKKTFDAIDNAANGVIFCGSMVKMSDITDGCSNTYLLGEKYLNPDADCTGQDPGDNAAALVGDNENVARWTFLPPLRDAPGYAARWRFGSSHPSGFSMAFCDGAVKLIDFAIDPKIHRSLGNRKDGQPTENPLP